MVNANEGGRYALDAGRTLGQYRVIKSLGKGGMGEVYLVEHEILRTRHALKLLPGERAQSSGFLQRFRDEARVMAQLRHPGIVHVTHADISDGHHYLVMDFVAADSDGTPYDLEEALAAAPEGRLPPDVAARLAIGICAAVGHAHAQGVIHRDLKPANVLLTSRDLTQAEVRVADFGLARLVGEDWLRSVINNSLRESMSLIGDTPSLVGAGRESRNTTGAILGTYEYMSPEQREGGDVDERSDIYALGVMLYRMVTGKRLVGRAKAASRLVEGLDPAWDEVIDACLEENVEDRPPNMGVVRGALEMVLRGEKTRSEAATRTAREKAAAEQARLIAEQTAHAAKAAQNARQEADRRAREAARQTTRERPPQPQQREATAGGSAGSESSGREPTKRAASARPGWFKVIAIPLVGVLALWAWSARISPAEWRTLWAPPTPSRTPGHAAVQPQVRAPEQQPSHPGLPAPAPVRPITTSGKAGEPLSVDLGGVVKLEMVWLAALKGWVGKYEVKNAEYRRFKAGHDSGTYEGRSLNGARQPVVQVSYDDAVAFAQWVQRTAGAQIPGGYTMRLPDGNEWMTFAQCGDGREYPWGNNWPPKSGQAGNYADTTAKRAFSGWSIIDGYDDGFAVSCDVEKIWANPWGLYGVGGNVWEWTSESSGSSRVLRGASWSPHHSGLSPLRLPVRFPSVVSRHQRRVPCGVVALRANMHFCLCSWAACPPSWRGAKRLGFCYET
jgi:formylglycine-generating enzyme required for sulfatase activity/tRNA A-37 threonylcarbamoyl transferase component Bud32